MRLNIISLILTKLIMNKKGKFRNMPTTSITGRVKTIVWLSNAEYEKLIENIIATQEELSFVKFEDLNDSISMFNWRKLDMTRRYLESEGNDLTARTTIEQVRNYLKTE